MSIPAIIVSGYLGAGKTTLINRFLADPKGIKATVLVNDFGAINLDAALIENSDGRTMALTNGCACCAIGDDLFAAAREAASSGTYLVVIEASGVSEPRRMAMILRGVSGLEPATILTCVNGAAAQRNARDKFIGRLFQSQISAAGFLKVNRRSDGNDILNAYLRTHAPQAALIDGLADILGHRLQVSTGAPDLAITNLPDFESAVFVLPGEVDLTALEAAFAQTGRRIERAKGFVDTAHGPVRIDFVQGGFSAQPASCPQENLMGRFVVITPEPAALLELEKTMRHFALGCTDEVARA
jgi:G3E family GTPase